MKFAFLTPFYPYRGGISQFSVELTNQLNRTNEVNIVNYKRQYPSILFPGSTQFVEEFKGNALTEGLDSIHPISYLKTAKKINRIQPEVFLSAYWMSFFSPCIGIVARLLNKPTKRIGLIHNLIPHEPRFFDKILATFYLKSHDAFVVMSESVKKEILSILPDASILVVIHPLYNQFGESIPRQIACEKLKIQDSKKNILFFGLIRDYKGLDTLLQAVSLLPEDYYLIIAGECYGSFEKYASMITEYKLENRVKIDRKFIPDNDVATYFSASDLVVLPYKSATQSGVTAVAHHFEIPIIATNVGGLKESINHLENGLITEENTPVALAKCIQNAMDSETYQGLKRGIQQTNKERSWPSFGAKLVEFCRQIERK